MTEKLDGAHQNFIEGVSRISRFWGFPKAMGAVYGAIYLSPDPVTLDWLVDRVGVSKGAASTNVRNLERMGMIHRKIIVGDRKDYYTAETDFWKIIKRILREREKTEFSAALAAVSESLDLVKQAGDEEENHERAAFYRERLQGMKNFFDTLDNFVAMALALDTLRLSSLKSLIAKLPKEERNNRKEAP